MLNDFYHGRAQLGVEGFAAMSSMIFTSYNRMKQDKEANQTRKRGILLPLTSDPYVLASDAPREDLRIGIGSTVPSPVDNPSKALMPSNIDVDHIILNVSYLLKICKNIKSTSARYSGF